MKRTVHHFRLLIIACALLAGCASQQRIGPRDLPALARANPERLLLIAVHNEAPLLDTHAGSTYRGYSDDAGYAVSDQARRALQSVAADYALNKLAEWPITLLQMQCAVYEIPPGVSRDSLLATLNADARVRLAQPLQSFVTQSLGGSGDTAEGPRAADSMNVRGAHQLAQGNRVRIAIVDTGVDALHPDLAGRVDVEINFVDADAHDFHLDRHGTAVAGVIAARGDSELGPIGIAPQAHLLALKACWQLQSGRDDARCNSYTLAQALAKAIELHAQVINLSLTGPADPLLAALVERANLQGIVVVGPGSISGVPGFPAGAPGVLNVISAEAGTATAERILRAPGNEVLTLAPGARYSIASGDSIATAAISGVSALLLSLQPGLNGEQVQKLLSDATETLPGHGDDRRMVNACRAVATLGRGNCPIGSYQAPKLADRRSMISAR